MASDYDNTNSNTTYYPPAEAYVKANTKWACPVCYSPVAPKRPQDPEGRCKSHAPSRRKHKYRDVPDPDENYAYV